MPDLNLDFAEHDDAAPAIPPIVSGEPQEIAPGVFVIPDDKVPLVSNIGIVVGDRATLVIDTGIGPRSGAFVRDTARKLSGDRPLYLTLTHYHAEHGYGAQAFKDATIVYNREQREECRQKAAGWVDTFREMGDHVAEQLEDIEFVDPDIVYDGAAEIDLGGKTAQLRTWGTAHTRGDQIVFLPEDRILFTGDLVEDGFYPIFPFFPPHEVDVDGANWLRVLDELTALQPAIVVPGHGNLGDAGLIDADARYLGAVQSETRRLTAEGKDAEEIVALLQPQMEADFPGWDASEPWRIGTGVNWTLAQQ